MDIQYFKDGKLSEFEKNSQVLSAFCDNDNILGIKSVLNGLYIIYLIIIFIILLTFKFKLQFPK